jgi:hypothetical protein
MMAARALPAKAGFGGVIEDAKEQMRVNALNALLNLP